MLSCPNLASIVLLMALIVLDMLIIIFVMFLLVLVLIVLLLVNTHSFLQLTSSVYRVSQLGAHNIPDRFVVTVFKLRPGRF